MPSRSLSLLALSTLIAAVPACSSPEESTSDPEPSSAVQFQMSTQLDPGQEAHRCQYVQMPADRGEEVFVSRRAHKYTGGSHHYALYRTSLTELEPGMVLGETFDCFEGDADRFSADIVVVEQVPEASYQFPEGVAMPFRAGEILLMQTHYLNADSEPLDAQLDVTLDTVPAEEVEQRAGLLQFYNPYIVVPAGGSGVARFECAIPQDITLLGANPHMHHRGTHFEAFIDDPGKEPSEKPFLGNSDWEHPESWTGVTAVAAGSTVRFQCDYDNPDAVDVYQGQSADKNEMCMFWGYYYPKLEDRAAEGCFGGAGFGSGTRTCAETSTCLQGCPASDSPKFSGARVDVGECFQKCMVDSCQSAGKLLADQSLCIQTRCAAECSGGDCTACVTKKCLEEAVACQTTACE